jgi:hypothetical protein
MLIDDTSKISRLSSTAVGMDHFQPIYCFIWYKLLNTIKNNFIMIENKMYSFYGKIIFENDKMGLEFADIKGDIKRIDDLELYVKNTDDISDIGKQIDNDLDSFFGK